MKINMKINRFIFYKYRIKLDKLDKLSIYFLFFNSKVNIEAFNSKLFSCFHIILHFNQILRMI